MARFGPPGLSVALREQVWQGWKAGQTLEEIGTALGKHFGSVYHVIHGEGGIAPRSRRRSPRALSLSDREEVSRGIAAGLSSRGIAARIGRAPSTVSREIDRNGGPSRYRASKADSEAWERARRPKRCRLATHLRLQRIVATKLQLEWSPEQISGWLKREFPDDEGMRVSTETIYRSLFVQARGALKKELIGHLRSGKIIRRKGKARGHGITDAVSIRERPAEVEDRAIPGHWEGDLLCGSNNSFIATLVERQTRFTMLVRLPSKETAPVVAALAKHVRKLPAQLRRSLTWDRGWEMGQHKDFTVATDVQVYFCDPQSPWQRGSNENTNGLLRQYFPKRTDLSGYSQSHLNKVALRLNQRPRKTLGFETPADKLNAVLR